MSIILEELKKYTDKNLAEIMLSYYKYGNIIYQNNNKVIPNSDCIIIDTSSSSKYSHQPTIDNIEFKIDGFGILSLTTTGKILHMTVCNDPRCRCEFDRNGPIITTGNINYHRTYDSIVIIQEHVLSDKEYYCEIIGLREVYTIYITSNLVYNGHGCGVVLWYNNMQLYTKQELV
jgi:hypothetical protein